MASQKSFPQWRNGEATPTSIAQSAENGKAKVSLDHLQRLCPWRGGPSIAVKLNKEDDDSSDSSSPMVRGSSVLSVSTAGTFAATKSLSQFTHGSGSFSSDACLSDSLLEDQDSEGESKANTGSDDTSASCEDAKDPIDCALLGRIRHAVFGMHGCLKLQQSIDGKDGFDERLDPVIMEGHSLNNRADRLRTDAAVLSFCREGLLPKVSENSWLSQHQARQALQSSTTDEMQTDGEMCRKMKGILNKLTIEKFSELSRQLISCGIRTSSHLQMLIQEVFEKAITQHHFINMYADLCVLLHIHFAENPITDDPDTNFTKILSTAFQVSFEKYRSPPVSLKTLEGEELAQGEQLYKMRMLGNIRFIGALLVRKMFSSQVMFAIMEELLTRGSAEALESLAALLTVVGPVFDVPYFPNRIMLTVIFDKVRELCKKSETSVRVRCLLQDVLDLQANSWTDRKLKKLDGPSTLEQVAQKFRTETAAAHTGPFQRSATHNRHRSSTQGAPALFWAGIDGHGDVTLTQSVASERRQSGLQCDWGEEPNQKTKTMPSGFGPKDQQMAALKNSKQRNRDRSKLLKAAAIVSPGDPIKGALVDKIRRFQKIDMDVKQAWGAFCESQEGNNRDPARYPVDVLQQWVQDHCSSGFPIKQSSSGQSTVSASPSSQENPIKDALVQKIRSHQRADMGVKQAWGAFCESQEGNTRDPARYPVDVLQWFVQDHCSSAFRIKQSGYGQSTVSASANSQENIPSDQKPDNKPEGPNMTTKELCRCKVPSDQKPDDKPQGPNMTTKELCRSKVRKEFAGILDELSTRLSHNVEEAVSRIATLDVPGQLQKKELCQFLGRVAEEGSEVVRKAGFELVVNLFDKGHWKPSALGNGLQTFIDDVCADLKVDVPSLPKILCEELCPVLQPFVKRRWLSANHLKALAQI